MSNYQVDVLVNGKPIRKFRHKGDAFIEGRKGSTFELRFTNNTWKRVEVVVSVDGLSVINGKPCGVESEGYVVAARESVVIPGWRLHNDAVAEFVFNDKDRSYTAATGEGTTNAGVIGVMVFEEEVKAYIPITPWPKPYWPNPYNPNPDPWMPGPTYYGTSGSWSSSSKPTLTRSNIEGKPPEVNIVCDSMAFDETPIHTEEGLKGISITTSSNPPLMNNTTEVFELGTGWGDEVSHHVTMVEFTRLDAVNPNKLLSIYYDTRKGLENRGIQIIKTKKKKVKKLPNAFPTYGTGATPPPGWKGKKR